MVLPYPLNREARVEAIPDALDFGISKLELHSLGFGGASLYSKNTELYHKLIINESLYSGLAVQLIYEEEPDANCRRAQSHKTHATSTKYIPGLQK